MVIIPTFNHIFRRETYSIKSESHINNVVHGHDFVPITKALFENGECESELCFLMPLFHASLCDLVCFFLIFLLHFTC